MKLTWWRRSLTISNHLLVVRLMYQAKTVFLLTILLIIRQIIPKRFLRVHVPFTLLKIMKPLIPFDVDGLNLSRISKQDRCFLAKSDIYKDLRYDCPAGFLNIHSYIQCVKYTLFRQNLV